MRIFVRVSYYDTHPLVSVYEYAAFPFCEVLLRVYSNGVTTLRVYLDFYYVPCNLYKTRSTNINTNVIDYLNNLLQRKKLNKNKNSV